MGSITSFDVGELAEPHDEWERLLAAARAGD
jgi:hypothetical protein